MTMDPRALQDRRQDRATIAANTVTRNTPASLMVLALVLFVVSLVALAWCRSLSGTARARFEGQLARAESIRAQVAEVKALRATLERRKETRGNELINDMPVRIKEACASESLKAFLSTKLPSERTPTYEAGTGLGLRKIEYRSITHESADEILAWVDAATRSVSGLEVEKISLRPNTTNWMVDVTFARWERKAR
jgi:hypothetical protein